MTIKTDILSGREARDKLKKGAAILADAVASTLGPSGRNAGIAYANERGIYGRLVMHDGVTVAKAIELEDEFENFAAQILKETARKQVDMCGDGTTVATLLSNAIFTEIDALVVAGYDPMLLQKGIEKAVEDMIAEIKQIAIPVKTLEQKKQIATVSAQDDELGEMVAKVIDDMGEDGLVVVEESTGSQTTVDKQAGFQFEKGWGDPNFMTNPDRGEATLEQPYILIADGLINDLTPIKGLLQQLADAHKKLVIIAPQFGLLAAGAMIDNKARGILPCLLVEAPSFGQNQKNVLFDIALFTKGKFFSENTGLKLEDATMADLGRCEYIKSTKKDTIIVGGAGEKAEIDMRVAEIKKMIELEEADFDKDKLKERLAKLTSGVAVIRVGGATEAEMKGRLERVKDSVAATRAAVKKGIVPGGETVYLTIRQKLDQKDPAQNILYKALYQPFKKLLNNAALNDGEYYEKLKSAKPNSGVNVVTQQIIDMVKDGIIDPALVPIEALRNASSTALVMASTDTIIIQRDIDKK
jgi:chaperonin GroEL